MLTAKKLSDATRAASDMKIRYLSDLHMEFTQYQPDEIPSVGEDLVVLAGDVGGVSTRRYRRLLVGSSDRIGRVALNVLGLPSLVLRLDHLPVLL